MSTNSYKRFTDTLNHVQPDRPVVDFGATAVSGIHVLAIEGLRKHYGLDYKPVKVIEPYQMLGQVEEDLANILQIDTEGVYGRTDLFGLDQVSDFKEFKTHWGQLVLVPSNFEIDKQEDGSLLLFPQGNRDVAPSAKMPSSGYFFDALNRQKPIDDANLNVEDNLEEFGLVSDEDLEHWKEATKKARLSGKGVVASLGGTALGDIALVPAMQLLDPKGIRDVADWYMSTVLRSDYVKEIFERQSDIALENLKRYNDVLGEYIDVVFMCGTDFGTQDSTFCAPEQYDDVWMPYYKKMNNWIHENTDWKTFKHCCGAVEPFMTRFIESGFDIINPVQINAAGMDPALLKEKYGKDLVFWGGGSDTQKILPSASPEKVREETLRLIDIFNKDGGFVFNTVHNVQANVPVENMAAMFDAVKEAGGQ